MIETEYSFDGKVISYELIDNSTGYIIYLDNRPWIKQTADYIPFEGATMDESALNHIRDIIDGFDAVQDEENEKEALKRKLEETSDTLDFLLTTVLPEIELTV